MDEEEEQVMSEVHLGCPPGFSGPFVSYFTFPLPPATDVVNGRCNDRLEVGASSSQMLSLDNDDDLLLTRRSDNSGKISLDKDGDLALTRRSNNHQSSLNCRLTIQHNITSSLPNVGLQVWRAALILGDFVLHKISTSCEFNDITAMELGAGTGLVGIILAQAVRSIFVTDVGVQVLDNCASNILVNSSLLKFHESAVRVRELDWSKTWPPTVETSIPSEQRSRYSWDSSEIEEAEEAKLLLAADIIYSDELTNSFFSILERLMSRGSEKVLYLALEKRYNFSLDDLDTVANGYAHFRSFLKSEEEYTNLDNTLQPCFLGEQMDLNDIPQYIREYERGTDLEMWKITYKSR